MAFIILINNRYLKGKKGRRAQADERCSQSEEVWLHVHVVSLQARGASQYLYRCNLALNLALDLND